MTASLARNGKGKAVLGRCLTATTFPQRQRRRISNFFAGSDSAPRLSSIGPAVLTGTFPPQGHHSPVAAISSPKAGDTGRALNWVERGQPLRNPGVGAHQRAGAPGGRVERVGSATASFIPLRGELAGDPAQDFTKRSERLHSVGLRHGHNHEGSRAHEVVKVCREFGNVCRA